MRTLGVLTLVGTLVLASLAVMPLTTAPSAAAVGFDDSWDYTNYRGTPLPFLDANGTVEIRQSNTASDFTGSYFDSLLRGSFPWGVTTGTALPSGLTSVSGTCSAVQGIIYSLRCTTDSHPLRHAPAEALEQTGPAGLIPRLESRISVEPTAQSAQRSSIHHRRLAGTM